MKKYIITYSFFGFAFLAVVYPLWVRLQNVRWTLDATVIPTLFPFFGLAAFSLMWLHIISGVWKSWLNHYINFERFVHITSLIVLVCIILHPLLLLMMLDFHLNALFQYGKLSIWFAITGWFFLVTYDLGRTFKRNRFFIRHWNSILLISTVGFLLTFFHSLGVGSDLQSGPLRIVWMFYGSTAILATLYTYGIKRILK